MNWTTPKSQKEVLLDGVTVEVDRNENSFVSVTLTDASGHKIRVRKNDYSIVLEVPKPAETKEKFAVTGTLRGVPVSETFEHEYEALQRKNDLSEDLSDSDIALKVEPTQVVEDIPW
jgi:hypothetical protein